MDDETGQGVDDVGSKSCAWTAASSASVRNHARVTHLNTPCREKMERVVFPDCQKDLPVRPQTTVVKFVNIRTMFSKHRRMQVQMQAKMRSAALLSLLRIAASLAMRISCIMT